MSMNKQTEYSNSYFDGRKPEWKDYILFCQWAETLGLSKSSTVLDYGCGTGKLVHVARYNGLQATGYDPNITEDQIFGLAKGVVVNKLPEYPKPFDLVICNDVEEHMPNEESVTASLKEIEKLTGRFAIFSITDLSLWETYVDPTHTFCRTRTWWENKLSEYFDLLKTPTDWAFAPQLYVCQKRQKIDSKVLD